MNQPDPLTPTGDDTISLLDLLVVIAENFKLLIGGPIAVALMALAVTFSLPERFESESWLRLEESAVPEFTSADVLIPLLAKAPWITAATENTEGALKALRTDIQAGFNKKDGLLRLKTQAPSPESAQRLNRALIEASRNFSLPKGRKLQEIEEQIKLNEASLQELGPIIERVANNLDKVTPGTEGDNVARAYINLVELKGTRQSALHDLKRQLLGFGEEMIAQSPSLPERPVNQKRALIPVLAGLASGMALLLFVFMRSGWRGAAQNPQDASKIQRIRQSLGLKPSEGGQG